MAAECLASQLAKVRHGYTARIADIWLLIPMFSTEPECLRLVGITTSTSAPFLISYSNP